jgi:hypothetical protein
MSPLGKPCSTCGARVTDGTSRCAAHKGGSGRSQPCKTCGVRTTTSGYCAEHDPRNQAERERRQPWRRAYDSPEAKAERQAALVRDEFRCVECRQGPADGVQLEVDHEIALSEHERLGIPLEVLINRNNLKTRCLKHHHAKTAKDRARRARERKGVTPKAP